IIFRSFRRILQQLQPLALPISRQREANSTALHAAVNTSFQLLPNFDELKPCTAETYATH
ncbi:hypothetical protein, partial [Pseudomonas sp. TWP3-1]|uniref:hypothetical protein n=1 Tax=Pseudomonas sp. TWP3-1 TaxID=2804631 RepID=UPI003CF9C9E8